MARVESISKDAEQVTVLKQGTAPEVVLPPVVDDMSITGSALDKNPDRAEPTPAPGEPEPTKIIFGEITETKVVHCNRSGGRVTLKAGKILSSQHYDLAHLARQGLKMREHFPEAAPSTTSIFNG